MISTTTAKVTYTLSSATQTLAINFKFLLNNQIVVIKNGIVDSTLVQTLDYTITGQGNDGGGSITLTGTVTIIGDVITIQRVVPYTQLTDYVPNDRFPAEVHEKDLDKIVMMIQQVLAGFKNVLRVPSTEQEMPEMTRIMRASKILAFDEDGNLDLSNSVDSIIAQAGGAGISPIVALLRANNLDDLANVVIARANLGLGSAALANVEDFEPAGGGGADYNPLNYGAIGDGIADDRQALQDCADACPSGGVFYAPAGTYRFTSGWGFSGKTNITIKGDGMNATFFKNDSGAIGGNSLVINWGCSNFEVRDISFTGTSTARGEGIHIRCAAPGSKFHYLAFSGSSGFALQITGNTDGYVSNVEVSNCFFGATEGDGVHFGTAADCLCANNMAVGTGDDSFAAVADYEGYPPARINFYNNKAYNAGFAGVSGCGLRICEGIDIVVDGFEVLNAVEAGVRVTRHNSITAYNYNIEIKNVRVRGTGTNMGQGGGIIMEWTKNSTVEGCKIDLLASGSGIYICDFDDLVLKDNIVVNSILRGIATNEGLTANVASVWNRLFILNNIFNSIAYEAIYLLPPSGISISNSIISGNSTMRAANLGGASYIYTDRLSGTCKITNNTEIGGKAITNGGSGISPYLANNN